MISILIVFPKMEDAKSIRNLLVRHGYDVAAVCTLGSQVLNELDVINSGIVVSGYKYQDMYYQELYDALPPDVDMLLLASARVCEECNKENLVCVSMPLKVHELINALEMMCMSQARKKKKRREKPRPKTEEERRTIREAKEILMLRNHMTEEEAHRYIQKCSMDSGTSIVETAQMVIHMNKI